MLSMLIRARHFCVIVSLIIVVVICTFIVCIEYLRFFMPYLWKGQEVLFK